MCCLCSLVPAVCSGSGSASAALAQCAQHAKGLALLYGAGNAGWMIMLVAFLLVGKAATLHQGPLPPSMQQMAVFPKQMMPQFAQLVPRQISQPQPKLSPVQQQGNAFGVQPNRASSPGHGPSSAGVGLYFKIDSLGRYFVETVLPKSSAEATGVVTKGDILEVVDDTPTQGVSLPQLRDLILGPPGTYVNLNFLREKGGEGFRYDIDLIRGDPMELPGVAEHAAEDNALSPGKAASPGFQRAAAHKAQRYAAPAWTDEERYKRDPAFKAEVDGRRAAEAQKRRRKQEKLRKKNPSLNRDASSPQAASSNS